MGGTSQETFKTIMASEKKPTHVYLLYEQKILKDFSSDNQYMKEEKPKIRQAIKDIECLAKRDYNIEGVFINDMYFSLVSCGHFKPNTISLMGEITSFKPDVCSTHLHSFS